MERFETDPAVTADTLPPPSEDTAPGGRAELAEAPPDGTPLGASPEAVMGLLVRLLASVQAGREERAADRRVLDQLVADQGLLMHQVQRLGTRIGDLAADHERRTAGGNGRCIVPDSYHPESVEVQEL